jgi:hypothetical protein
VLDTCVNPVCGAQFLYLHQGKLFEVETQYFGGKAGKARGYIERCWLGDECAADNVLRFDAGWGVVMICCLGNSDEGVPTALPQSVSNSGTGIARVVIRPFDLTVDGIDRRKAAGELSMRRRDVA